MSEIIIVDLAAIWDYYSGTKIVRLARDFKRLDFLIFLKKWIHKKCYSI